MVCLKSWVGQSLTSRPLTKTSPSVGSYILGIKLMSVDFPEPVPPIMTKFSLSWISNEMFFSTYFEEFGYLKDTFLKDTYPSDSLSAYCGESCFAIGDSKTSLIRSLDALALDVAIIKKANIEKPPCILSA